LRGLKELLEPIANGGRVLEAHRNVDVLIGDVLGGDVLVKYVAERRNLSDQLVELVTGYSDGDLSIAS